MGATVLSKVLGLVREMMLAAAYGAGNSVAEAFSGALSVPSTFFDILFSAAILGCFIPVYNSFKGNTEKSDEFACIFFNAISLLTGVLALLGILFAEPIINIVTPGLEDTALAVNIVRILFPMIIFTGMAYTLVGVMQSKGKFFLPALISSVSNAGVIVYFLFLNNFFGVYGLAVAYVAAWFIQFLTLAVPLVKGGFKFKVLLDFNNPELIAAIKMVPPIMIGSWLAPMTILVGKHFASYFNGVATFNYANQTYIMIAGILVYSICNYVFPTLSRLADEGDEEKFNLTVRTGTSAAMFIIIPFMFAVVVLAGEGTAILYMRGEFSAQNTADTASALRIIAFAMPFYGAIEIFSRVFYSKKKTFFPMLASICGVAAMTAICTVGVRVFGAGLDFVAGCAALGQLCAALVLCVSAALKVKGIFTRDFTFNLIKELVCGLVMCAVMMLVHKMLQTDPYSAGIYKNIGVCALTFVCGAVMYIVFAAILRVRFEKRGSK